MLLHDTSGYHHLYDTYPLLLSHDMDATAWYIRISPSVWHLSFTAVTWYGCYCMILSGYHHLYDTYPLLLSHDMDATAWYYQDITTCMTPILDCCHMIWMLLHDTIRASPPAYSWLLSHDMIYTAWYRLIPPMLQLSFIWIHFWYYFRLPSFYTIINLELSCIGETLCSYICMYHTCPLLM